MRNSRPCRHRASTLVIAALLVAGGSAAFAANPPTTHSAPSKAMRAKMAALHEQMAVCLRSDKPISECRSQMMQGCKEMMGKQGCPMMMGMKGGMMRMGSGMHGHMMRSPPASSSNPP